jgi:uncharacterized protein YdhG (YjbR/CyaY superfamily)
MDFKGKKKMSVKPATVSQYISAAPKEGQAHLKELRELLKKVAPKAKEAIKWGSPVFEENRILFAFSAFKNHVNFMPTRKSLDFFRVELKDYKTGKDTIQFPYDKKLPKALIKKIAMHRAKDVRENDAKWM